MSNTNWLLGLMSAFACAPLASTACDSSSDSPPGWINKIADDAGVEGMAGAAGTGGQSAAGNGSGGTPGHGGSSGGGAGGDSGGGAGGDSGASGAGGSSCDPNAWVHMDNDGSCAGNLGESCGWTPTNEGQGYHCQTVGSGVLCKPGGTTCPSTNFPPRLATPYVGIWDDNDLVSLANSTGHKFYTLAFVLSRSGACDPAWDGTTDLTGNNYGSYIAGLRGLGGDVIVSCGGAGGTELGLACSSVSDLQSAYQKVVSQFQLTRIDLDIEGDAASDASSIDRRNKAIHNLQVANPDLRLSYTLAVQRNGLPGLQIGLLQNAQANGVTVDVVNIMAMDYGPCYTDMGQAAIDAASATRTQLQNIGMDASVGVTPMIGTNDVACEVFSTTDAQQLVTYAQSNSYITWLAYWQLSADINRTYLGIFHSFH
jgi:hypothetical protein